MQAGKTVAPLCWQRAGTKSGAYDLHEDESPQRWLVFFTCLHSERNLDIQNSQRMGHGRTSG